MSNQKKEQKLAECQELLAQHKESGLTIKEFCKQKDISPGKWHYSRRMCANHAKISPRKLSPVKIISNTVSEGVGIKLALPNGFQILLPADIEVTRVKQLVEALLSC